ncbi:RNA 2',3'-cyclic phosphodiesterase [Nitrosococcus watsonii]|uniref:RNA 2',3'-cyclic phosphodiesterase n=1 Tax=Nitrosococcus watsoni (strain C-113) TaxID=105559 RepID=D8KBY2_NITWC|nr:RNA 2',3'-cyclic phosphodiesterase [Nitrosococcus watsonii]ADJ27743.1 2'-5' RNA ligase [Nitrosococcus watsonii C-113]
MSWSSPLPETQRLFFALWPEVGVREQAARLARRMLGKQGKRVRPENLHLTLVFLGSMTEQQRACAEAVADTIDGPAFTLRLEQIGHWPRPRVVWLAPQETPKPLLELAQQLNQGLAACGYQPEARPYRAHMTLARKVAGYFPAREVAPLVCPVEYFYLMQSVTYPRGVEYQVLRTWPLAP